MNKAIICWLGPFSENLNRQLAISVPPPYRITEEFLVIRDPKHDSPIRRGKSVLH